MSQVLARRFRPQTLADLIGKEAVARTLRNAVAAGRTAHAYLFTGVRGTGKTTVARILAKCLNCETGPTPEPCLACVPCQEIADGRALDVLELDAASRTGIDDIRELQDSPRRRTCPPPSSPAACGCASPSPGRWSPTPACSCSTSRSPRSTN